MAGGLVYKGTCDTEVLFVLRSVSRAETLDPVTFVHDVMIVMVYCNMFTFTSTHKITCCFGVIKYSK